MLTIRPYKETDLESVTTLWGMVFPDSPPWNDPKTDINRKLSIQRDLFLIALLDEELVGTAMGGYDGHRGWIYSIAVSKANECLSLMTGNCHVRF